MVHLSLKNEWIFIIKWSFYHLWLSKCHDWSFTSFFKKVRYKRKGENPREFYKLSDVNIDYLHKLIEPFIFEADLVFDKKRL